jgi:flagellar hook-associated protein 1
VHSDASTRRLSAPSPITFRGHPPDGADRFRKAQDGVDTDQEMQMLLVIEKNYAANAKVIQTVNDMIDIADRVGIMTRVSLSAMPA